MVVELKTIESSLFSKLFLTIAGLEIDHECAEYDGHNFKLDKLNIKYRKSKRTPTKIGQFVTLWKRDANAKTAPHHLNDDFDFYIIVNRDEHRLGFFFFPKAILGKNHILTTEAQIGKRGFRLYAPWDAPANKQALRAQDWQKTFFINLEDDLNDNLTKLHTILTDFQPERSLVRPSIVCEIPF